MKKTLLFLILFFTFSSQHIFSENLQFDNLVHKVDSLEHELSYLKLKAEINYLNNDMSTFSNALYSQCLTIKLDISNRNFDEDNADMYQRYYNACKERFESISELVDVSKLQYLIEINSPKYTESEQNILKSRFDVISTNYKALKSSIEYLKFFVDTYKKYV